MRSAAALLFSIYLYCTGGNSTPLYACALVRVQYIKARFPHSSFAYITEELFITVRSREAHLKYLRNTRDSCTSQVPTLYLSSPLLLQEFPCSFFFRSSTSPSSYGSSFYVYRSTRRGIRVAVAVAEAEQSWPASTRTRARAPRSSRSRCPSRCSGHALCFHSTLLHYHFASRSRDASLTLTLHTPFDYSICVLLNAHWLQLQLQLRRRCMRRSHSSLLTARSLTVAHSSRSHKVLSSALT